MLKRFIERYPEIAALACLSAAAAAFFAFTDPRSVPPTVLVIAFMLVAGIVFAFLRLVIRLTELSGRLSAFQYKALLYGGTSVPVVLLAMQSIGQLTVRDVITLALLYVFGYFYLSRISPGRDQV